MKHLIISFAFTFALLMAHTAHAIVNDKRIGIAAGIIPQTVKQNNQQQDEILSIGNNLAMDEIIKTGPEGRAQILFLDGSSMNIGPNSYIVLDQFVFDPESLEGEITTQIKKGSMRFIGGALSKAAGQVKIVTDEATIGIRGGIAKFIYEENQGVKAQLIHGTMTVATTQGIFETSRIGTEIFATPSGEVETRLITSTETKSELDKETELVSTEEEKKEETKTTKSVENAENISPSETTQADAVQNEAQKPEEKKAEKPTVSVQVAVASNTQDTQNIGFEVLKIDGEEFIVPKDNFSNDGLINNDTKLREQIGEIEKTIEELLEEKTIIENNMIEEIDREGVDISPLPAIPITLSGYAGGMKTYNFVPSIDPDTGDFYTFEDFDNYIKNLVGAGLNDYYVPLAMAADTSVIITIDAQNGKIDIGGDFSSKIDDESVLLDTTLTISKLNGVTGLSTFDFSGNGKIDRQYEDEKNQPTEENNTASFSGSAKPASQTSAISAPNDLTHCACEFLSTGIWQIDFTNELGDAFTINQHWVAGNFISPDRLPQSGTAQFSGHMIGEVFDAGARRTAMGNMSMNYSFVSEQGAFEIDNFDNRLTTSITIDGYTNPDNPANLHPQHNTPLGLGSFAGSGNGTVTGHAETAAINIDGHFYQDSAGNLGGSAGGFNIIVGNEGVYSASGVFMAE